MKEICNEVGGKEKINKYDDEETHQRANFHIDIKAKLSCKVYKFKICTE